MNYKVNNNFTWKSIWHVLADVWRIFIVWPQPNQTISCYTEKPC